jgi:16S rRNA (cytidine1402-2'-O)-methyltransferase
MPSVSDPGLRAVRAVVEAGLAVTAVPGASAVPVALALSGLATDRFCFEGFPPRAAGARRRTLAGLAGEQRTMVFFESRHRIAASLAAMAEAFGPERRAAVCRELTKVHEEVRRDTLAVLAAWAAREEPLGEITVVVAGAEPAPVAMETLVEDVRERVAAGERRSSAVADVARAAGVRRGALYDAVLASMID